MVKSSTTGSSLTVFLRNVTFELDEAQDERIKFRREGDATMWRTFGRNSSTMGGIVDRSSISCTQSETLIRVR
jgi:hypothetical protein